MPGPPKEVLNLLRRLSIIATQMGFVVPENDYKKTEALLQFRGRKVDIAIEVQLTPPDGVTVKLTELNEAGRPKLGSNVLTTHFNNAEIHMSTMLNEYFR
jgi:hypothetical protein